MKFLLGKVVATANALETLESDFMQKSLNRHILCDWGEELCDEDTALNNEALELGNRLLSAYKDDKDNKLWIITEADRSVTTLLLPEDY